jgi:succinate dehydrogenase cytochrome b556 subunit
MGHGRSLSTSPHLIAHSFVGTVCTMLAHVASRYLPWASARRGIILGRYSSSIADRSVRPPTASRGRWRSATTYSEEQQRIGRPISPHVTVYKQTLPAIASIMNRVSGVALSLGLATGSVVAATVGDVPTLIWSAIHSTPGATPLAKFLVAYPLMYHWMNAVRHQVRTARSYWLGVKSYCRRR